MDGQPSAITVDVMGAGRRRRAIVDRELDSGDFGWLSVDHDPLIRGAPPAFYLYPRPGEQQALRNSIASAIEHGNYA